MPPPPTRQEWLSNTYYKLLLIDFDQDELVELLSYQDEIVACAMELYHRKEETTGIPRPYSHWFLASLTLAMKTILQYDMYHPQNISVAMREVFGDIGLTPRKLMRMELELLVASDFIPCRNSPSVRLRSLSPRHSV